MNHNLATPWSDGCSPPQNPFLAFYSPQRDDLLFAGIAEIELRCQAGLRSVALRWTLHRNQLVTPFREGVAEALPGNRFAIRLATAGLHPGFYDLRVELDTGLANREKTTLAKRPASGVCTFGWEVDRMAIAETRPADFAAFWATARATLAAVPLATREEPLTTFGPAAIDAYNLAHACLPPDYDPGGHRAETVEAGKVSFAGPDGGRVHGWLAKPEGKGPFPAMLILPGAGNAARPRPLEHARHGYLALDLQVHGQEVDLAEYRKLPQGTPCCDPPSAYAYYQVHRRCVRAVDYLVSRPDVDPSRIVAVGGSQGGRLAIVLAGLDARVSAVVAAIAHFANQPHQRWIARCNGDAAKDDGMALAGAPPVDDDALGRGLAYYDPMNVAPDVRCPVLMNAGLIDPVSPPSCVWAAYRRLGTADKTIVALAGHGHDWSAEFDRRAWRWLDQRFAQPAQPELQP